jgi:hypothetical protein
MMCRLPKKSRWFAALILALSLTISPASSRPVLAQEPAPAEGEGDKGRPLDGYLGTLCLVMAALFIVGKSARR